MTRFHKFFHSLLDSPSPEVRVLVRLSARDLRTNIGKNLRSIHDETGLDPWLFGGQRLKEELLHYNMKPVPEKDKWRIRLLEKYMGIRSQAYYIGWEIWIWTFPKVLKNRASNENKTGLNIWIGTQMTWRQVRSIQIQLIWIETHLTCVNRVWFRPSDCFGSHLSQSQMSFNSDLQIPLELKWLSLIEIQFRLLKFLSADHNFKWVLTC